MSKYRRQPTLLQYVEDQLSVNGELPELSLTYSQHALTRFKQRHADVAESKPDILKVTKDNIIAVYESDDPDEVILKVSVPLYKQGEEIPSYYLAFVISLKEDKNGSTVATVITTYPYDRAQYLVKALGWGRRASRGKASFKVKSQRKRRKK